MDSAYHLSRGEVPPGGVNVTGGALLLPYRLDSEIGPVGTPARVLTAVSPRDIVAVAERPNSVFTFPRDIGPEDWSVMLCG
jgi:hypothetical protein